MNSHPKSVPLGRSLPPLKAGGRRPKAAYLLAASPLEQIYSPELRAQLGAELEIMEGPLIERENWREHAVRLAEVEILLSGWGMEPMEGEFLDAVPNLKLVLYGAGSVRPFFRQEAYARGIRVCSAWQANAVPVAEFAYATILLALKRVAATADILRGTRKWARPFPIPGAFDSTVGLVSLGAIGRRVARYLQSHDINVIAHDPYADRGVAGELGVELVSLETVFSRADVVSLHTPHLESTRGMITGELIASMKEGASLVNTARGQVIREGEMAEVLAARPDISAHLDVVEAEPLSPDSPLWTLPNVYLTPHIAGSMDRECERMGWYMYEELRRYLKGEPLQHEVTPELLEHMA
jgi:phosphoglycerate dehydrogenase-like enzyme